MTTELENNARIVAERLRRRRVVPFLGAGVNLADRPAGADWRRNVDLPSGGELATALAGTYGYPTEEPDDDLMRVTQYVEAEIGESAIYDEFHEIFAGVFEPTVVHNVLAAVPAILREKSVENPYLLIVTTNYDDAQERAFDAVGEPYDLVWYMARGDQRGQFIHQAPGGERVPVSDPAKSSLTVDDRNVILKIHGAACRADESLDSFVVTEDHYIEYMYATDLGAIVPVKLLATMLENHFLFLGYRLGDWNLRVFLHGLWAKRNRSATNWSVNRKLSELDRLLWRKRTVTMIEAPLPDYMSSLEAALRLL
jgi:SIR2-like domain